MKRDKFYKIFLIKDVKHFLIIFALIAFSFFSFSNIFEINSLSNTHKIDEENLFQKQSLFSSSNNTAPSLNIDVSTFFGGDSYDFPNNLAVDSAGNSFITGYTQSTNFPIKNAYNASLSGGDDVFITEINSSGSLIFSTYFGGSGNDTGYKICVDIWGNFYIVGETSSKDFPIKNAFQSNLNGANDVFLAKFNASDSLVFSTYFGGSGTDIGHGIGVDSSGNIYISGTTTSDDLPVKNAFSSTSNDISNVFVAKFNTTGSLEFSTYFGGSSSESNAGLAVDSQGNSYLTGYTTSSDFPMLHAYNSTFSSNSINGYVAKFNSTGSLVYSTYFSNGFGVLGNPIATDDNGNCYITGSYQKTLFESDVFIAKFNASGYLTFNTIFGGSGIDSGNAVVVNNNGSIYVTGDTFSKDFPLKNAYNTISGETVNTFVAEFNPNGEMILDTLIGGSLTDAGMGIGLDNASNVYIIGYTVSSNFPLKNAFQNSFPGGISGFLSKFSVKLVPIPSSSTSTTNQSSTSSKPHNSPDFTVVSILVLPMAIILFKRRRHN